MSPTNPSPTNPSRANLRRGFSTLILAVLAGCNGATAPTAKATTAAVAPASRTLAPVAPAPAATPAPAPAPPAPAPAPPAPPPPPSGPTTTTAPPSPAGVVPPDDVNLTTATVENSPADIATWPATSKITRLDLTPNGVHIEFTKRDGAGSWPDVPAFGPGPGHDLEYTLWIVIQVNGTWYTSGCIQYWRGLDANGGPPSGYAANWYYDAIRWGPMVGHQPAVGEMVGFFVAAGNERNVTVPDPTQIAVEERTNVVLVPFPTDAGASFTYP